MPDETPNPNWTPVPPPVDPAAAYPPPVDPAQAYVYPPLAPTGSVPNPALAGFLGLIPGVGAMYNGQFAKAIAHFIIFAVLASLADHHDFFGLLVAGWIFYQAFEAYHTARARRDGLPLPNPFGLNDIGERFGFNKSWTGTTPPASTPYATPYTGATPPPPAAQANTFGYVPPAAYATAPPPVVYPPVPPPAAPHVYADTYTGPYPAPGTNGFNAAPPVVVPPEPASSFPIAAVVLILLGALLLLGHLLPNLHISGEWIIPTVLFSIAVLVFVRRLRIGGNVICMLRTPVVLATLAVLFTLEAAGVATLGQTWPVLLLAVGGILLLERTVGRTPIPPAYAPPPADPSFVPRADWNDPPPPPAA